MKPGTVEVSAVHVKGVKEAKIPANKTELQSFLGMRSVYRRSVNGIIDIFAPLNELL